jgi:hypothetical protein
MTIEGLCQQPRRGGFTDAARAGKNIGVMKALMLNGIAQCASDGFLPGNLCESLRAPFACDYLIGHKKTERSESASPRVGIFLPEFSTIKRRLYPIFVMFADLLIPNATPDRLKLTAESDICAVVYRRMMPDSRARAQRQFDYLFRSF